jgi:hypothetical protein
VPDKHLGGIGDTIFFADVVGLFEEDKEKILLSLERLI